MPILKIVKLYCDRENKSKALFIYDSQHPGADLKIASAFTNFLYRSSLGRGFNKILEIPLFASSEVTPCLQLVDFAASVIRHYHTQNILQGNPKTEFEKWITELYGVVSDTTLNIHEQSSGYTHYGIYYMTKRIFQTDLSASFEDNAESEK